MSEVNPHPLPSPDTLLSVLSTLRATSMFNKMADLATRIGNEDALEAQESAFALYNKGQDLVLSELVVPDPKASPFGLEYGHRSVDFSPLIYRDSTQDEDGFVFLDEFLAGVRNDLAATAHTHPTGHYGRASIHRVMPSAQDMDLWKGTLRVNPNQLQVIMGADNEKVKFLMMRQVIGRAINDTFEAMEPQTEREALRVLKLSNVVCANVIFDRRAKAFQPEARTILAGFLEKDDPSSN